MSLAQFVTAFYTTLLFRLERFILKIAVSRPSTDAQAKQLAAGSIDAFAAWNVEARGKNQLLMCDFHRRTRSWLMVAPASGTNGTATRLLFGSAVVPMKHSATGQAMLGFGFKALLGFHKIYSVILLYATKLRLESKHRC